jgi:hypothetical protein
MAEGVLRLRPPHEDPDLISAIAASCGIPSLGWELERPAMLSKARNNHHSSGEHERGDEHSHRRGG